VHTGRHGMILIFRLSPDLLVCHLTARVIP
jgi:hypothetical protein